MFGGSEARKRRVVPSFDEVAGLVRKRAAVSAELTPGTALQSDLGLYGDDIEDLLAEYAARFGVDLSGYVWYFRTGEEGNGGFGAAIFPPPNRKVREIPITVGMLHRFAESGRWAVEYPPHDPPRRRPDLWINLAVLIAAAGLAIAAGARGCAP
jgi:hypothetical protein